MVDITQHNASNYKYGTTTKYCTTLSFSLANAGAASDITTPAAVATGTYYIRSEFATGCFTVNQ
jgi:hypothetical protein